MKNRIDHNTINNRGSLTSNPPPVISGTFWKVAHVQAGSNKDIKNLDNTPTAPAANKRHNWKQLEVNLHHHQKKPSTSRGTNRMAHSQHSNAATTAHQRQHATKQGSLGPSEAATGYEEKPSINVVLKSVVSQKKAADSKNTQGTPATSTQLVKSCHRDPDLTYFSTFQEVDPNLSAQIFPTQKPISTLKYNILYQRLDHEQTRIQIREQLNSINPDDTISAISTALQKGLLTSNKIHKILEVERQQNSRSNRRRQISTPSYTPSYRIHSDMTRGAFFSNKLVSTKNVSRRDQKIFQPNFQHDQVLGQGLCKPTCEIPDVLKLLQSQRMTLNKPCGGPQTAQKQSQIAAIETSIISDSDHDDSIVRQAEMNQHSCQKSSPADKMMQSREQKLQVRPLQTIQPHMRRPSEWQHDTSIVTAGTLLTPRSPTTPFNKMIRKGFGKYLIKELYDTTNTQPDKGDSTQDDTHTLFHQFQPQPQPRQKTPQSYPSKLTKHHHINIRLNQFLQPEQQIDMRY